MSTVHMDRVRNQDGKLRIMVRDGIRITFNSIRFIKQHLNGCLGNRGNLKAIHGIHGIHSKQKYTDLEPGSKRPVRIYILSSRWLSLLPTLKWKQVI